jgi:acetyl-CoA synthetase
VTSSSASDFPVGADYGSTEIVWRPSAEYIERSRLRRFMERVGVESFAALIGRAAADPAWFWDAVVRDLDLSWFAPYAQTLDLTAGVEWPRWFVGGRYNYVRDAVDKQAALLRPHDVAVAWEGEDGAVRSLTYAALHAEVCRAANALLALGVGPGDRVGVFLPMLPETIVATLAVSKVGAIFIPIFSGYGAGAVAARLAACEARLLITADAFYRGGKTIPMKATADQALGDAPTVERVLVVRRVGGDAPWTPGRDLCWDEALAGQAAEAETRATAADDPYMIIYTSGTTGAPKGIVHTHAGFPIKAAQELAHCFDLHAGDTLLWISDLGWMMGPWAIAGSLMLGATCLLYEGLISYPAPDRLWALAARHGVTHLGVSPTAVRALMSHGAEPVRRHDLSRLWVLAGAGEPWNPDPWRWLFEVVGGGTRPIINYSGGTEVSGGILACNTLLPLKPCAFSAPVPGMAADVVDAAGRSVRGEVGELAIRAPWVGVTQGFWRDPARYLDTYWARTPGLWVHGDWARIDEDGFWYILGRSDDTIKIAGKRVGPAEVESAAVAHPAVAEAAAVGVPDAQKGEALLVFVVLRSGQVPGEPLRAEIERAIVNSLGKSLKPQAVRFVRALPHTRNGKILRRLVRQRHLGEPLGDVSALESADALEAIADAT